MVYLSSLIENQKNIVKILKKPINSKKAEIIEVILKTI